METEKVKLSQVALNADNPRTITDEKLKQLIQSILVLPKMLELRPVVVDSTMVSLGGNMRLTALNKIAAMSPVEIFDILSGDDDFMAKTEGEREMQTSWWGAWLKDPFCYIMRGDMLSQDEIEQFIVKDNLSFGAWDWHKLTKKFSPLKLKSWGMDGVPNFTSLGQPVHDNDAQDEAFVENGVDTGFVNLPPELSGIDLEAEEHEDIKGDDKTEYSRMIICYKEEDIPNLCALLGIASLDKVVYNLEELLQ